MRQFFPRLLVLLFLVLLSFSAAKAQQCEGSYGDPVVKLDFGSGISHIGPQLEAGVTTMFYTSDCPEDGFYSIVNSQTSCNGNWHTVTTDHTGNPGGYMMFVNASNVASKFFTKDKDIDLCENTNYEFSAYVLNLLKPSASNGASQPDLLFTIKKPDGTILKQYDTNTIPPTSDPQWVKYSMPFSTTVGVTKIILEISNNAPGGNGNDFLLDDIEFRACGPLIREGFTTIGNTTPQNTCENAPATYNLIASVDAGYNMPRYQWQKSNDEGVTWADIVGATGLTYSFTLPATTPTGDYEYRMAAAEGNNIFSLNCRTYSGVLTVSVNPYPVVPVIQPVKVCEGEPVTINASGGVKYEWSGPGVTDANRNQQNLTIENPSAADAGNYQVKVTSAGDCTTPSNIVPLTVYAKPVFTVSNSLPICSGTSTMLSTTGDANIISYSWLPATGLSDPSSPNPTASPNQTTTYTVTAKNDGDCETSHEVTVTVVPSPTIIMAKPKKIFEGQSVVLDAQASNAGSYLWTPADGLDDPTKLNPTASPVDDITYTLHANSDIGCGIADATVFVRVFKKVVIPSSFSPNGDGKNDTWNIEALETYPQSQLKVFNRNGQVIFSSTGYSKPWNGGYNGYVLPSGTYYYTIDLKNDAPILSGWVYIAR